MPRLQIQNTRERLMVAAADVALGPVGWAGRRRMRPVARIERVLLLRLERIGDLLMAAEAIADARAAFPRATLDLAVGSWNLPLARLIPGITHLHTADVPWLAREGRGDSWPALVSKARAWQQQSYDLAINFEPDIRTNFLMWLSGAKRRHGYWTGGGRAFLTAAGAYAPDAHVSENARALVRRAVAILETRSADARGARREPADGPALSPPAQAISKMDARIAGLRRPIIGIHVGGGRESKQWHLDRFVSVARALAGARGATIVLTGSDADRSMVTTVASALGDIAPITVAGELDLVEMAALLSRLDLFISSDTGPMHIASAVHTPVVALFGPADERRYGPRAPHQRVLRVDLPCSPCGQVRLPPERCRGHVPDCMDGIRVETVVAAAIELLDEAAPAPLAATRGR